jgi:hypothetical protein
VSALTALAAREKSKFDEERVWHVPITAYKATRDVERTTVDLTAVELTMAAYDDVISSSMHGWRPTSAPKAAASEETAITGRGTGL